MQFSCTFRHMDASDAAREYAREKVERIKKYFPDPISAHVVMSTERGYRHAADVNIQLHNGLVIKGTETTEDMYSSIDLVMAKIERQVRRYKEKIRHHKAREGLGSIPVRYSILSPEANDEVQETPDRSARVVKTEHVPTQALSVDEAIMQLDLSHQPFLAFRNGQTGGVNVVYRHDDGTYGLIETGAPEA
jgi:putative sigma-54 modulation protein